MSIIKIKKAYTYDKEEGKVYKTFYVEGDKNCPYHKVIVSMDQKMDEINKKKSLNDDSFWMYYSINLDKGWIDLIDEDKHWYYHYNKDIKYDKDESILIDISYSKDERIVKFEDDIVHDVRLKDVYIGDFCRICLYPYEIQMFLPITTKVFNENGKEIKVTRH